MPVLPLYSTRIITDAEDLKQRRAKGRGLYNDPSSILINAFHAYRIISKLAIFFCGFGRRKGGVSMANRDIRKEKKKPKSGGKQSDAVLKAPAPQPELIKKDRKEK
jgi:hypothetical protein